MHVKAHTLPLPYPYPMFSHKSKGSHKKTCISQAVVVHTFSAHRSLTNLNRVSSRMARATQRNPILKKEQQRKKKEQNQKEMHWTSVRCSYSRSRDSCLLYHGCPSSVPLATWSHRCAQPQIQSVKELEGDLKRAGTRCPFHPQI